MALKERISSPLEAGPSILDAHYLPPHLTPSLEFVSSRLARKGLHLTLVVVRRDYQLPFQSLTPMAIPLTPVTPCSPPLSGGRSSGFARHLARWTRQTPLASPKNISPHIPVSPSTHDLFSLRSPWPLSPSTPLSPPPMTPCTTISSVATDHTGLSQITTDGFNLLCHGDLSLKAEKILNLILLKAARKFGLGNEWPSRAIRASGLVNQLINCSIAQNERLFFSDGLSLVSVDAVYSLKSALSSYTKTHSPLRLEDAVDDLRRYILSNNGIKVRKSDLLRSFDWLNVSNRAIADLDSMYRRAYGGFEGSGGISGMPCSVGTQMPEPGVESTKDDRLEVLQTPLAEATLDESAIGVALSTTPVKKRRPSPKLPMLTIRTSFEKKPKLIDIHGYEEEDEDTARPSAAASCASAQPWNHVASIDQILVGRLSEHSATRTSSQHGPMTPKGYEDISPITRGEWGFLTTDEAFRGARRVPVETF